MKFPQDLCSDIGIIVLFQIQDQTGVVHQKKSGATNRHGDPKQLKIGEMHIRSHQKRLI